MLDIDQSEEIKKYLTEFSKNPRGYLLLAGENGTGKTFAAQAVFSKFFCALTSVEFDDKIFIKQADLNFLWQKNLSEYGCANYLLKKFVYPKLLILDDIGTRKPTEAFMDFLYVLADKRYEQRNEKGTVLTTNLNASLMRQIFGDAFVSRVASGKCFRIDGPDRRIKDF